MKRRTLYNYYKLARSYEEAGLLAKKGGCDTEIPVGGAFRRLPEYVRAGELDEALLDESVRRVLTVKFKTGLFENPYCDVKQVRQAMNNREKDALSAAIAKKISGDAEKRRDAASGPGEEAGRGWPPRG